MERRISPILTKQKMEEGYAYVDCRSEVEFAAGHPEGAINVPFGPSFEQTMIERFPKNAKIVVGCQSGVRSRRAVAELLAAGFSDVFEQRAGYGGAKDSFGRTVEKGWAALGLPITKGKLG